MHYQSWEIANIFPATCRYSDGGFFQACAGWEVEEPTIHGILWSKCKL